MEKNTIFAVVLSFLVIFLWFMFFNNKKKVSNPRELANQEMKSEVVTADEKVQDITSVNDKLEMANSDDKYSFVLEDKNRKITFDKFGGITSYVIKEKNNNVELIYSDKIYPLTIHPNVTYFQTPVMQDESSLILIGKINDEIGIETEYRFGDDVGLINIKMQIRNSSREAKKITNFRIGLGPGIGTDEKLKYNQEIKDMSFLFFNNDKITKKPKEQFYDLGKNSWFSINNHYFCSILIDKNNFFSQFNVIDYKIPNAYYSTNLVLEPNSATTLELDTIWGIKNYKYLASFDKDLEKNLSLGIFSWLVKFLLWLLSLFYAFTKNYGWSIIILTAILQILLFPLNKKSYSAMHAMKKLQPKLEALKQKYKNDSQKMNMETMLLYKSEKVNPFGGCLPLLLQLPIFWALFSTLRNATELRHAPFVLWVKDLAKPDTIGHLAGIPINILPILMGLTMFLNQKINTVTSSDDMQNKMFLFMPILFLFMFWNFPSGLVLYWLVSNIFTLALNFYLSKQNK